MYVKPNLTPKEDKFPNSQNSLGNNTRSLLNKEDKIPNLQNFLDNNPRNLLTKYGKISPIRDAVKDPVDIPKPESGNGIATPTMDDIVNEILNRKEFSYDLNGDALYQRYKDQAVQQGKLAMRDTVGQVASMSGGYGNSYAQTAGQQAFNTQLDNLNDVIPELYQLAYDKWANEGDELVNKYSLLSAEREYKDSKESSELEKWYNIAQGNKNTGGTGSGSGSGSAGGNVGNLTGKPSNNVQAVIKDGDSDYSTLPNTGNDNTGHDNTGNDNAREVPNSIKQKVESFDSNIALGNYLDGLEASGIITPEQAEALYAQYMDSNEKFVTDDKGIPTSTYSYSEMVKSTNGWSVEDDGGWNFVGIDLDARVKAPNGESMTLKQLKEKLVDEGMNGSDASKVIKALQQNLGISSNWLFGW